MHLFRSRVTQIFCVVLFPAFFTATALGQQSGPPLLAYDDLVALYENDVPADLAARLNRLLTTPFVNNSAGVRGQKAGARSDFGKRFIRVATWNIERGLEFEAVKAALTNDQRFFRRLPVEARASKFNLNKILEEAARLSRADVIVLNEADWGVKRTDYRNVTRELAAELGMNYAFGVEFVEVDPLTLGTETFEGEISADKEAMVQNLAVDKARTLGLHGTAILSRFPLRNVRLVPFANQGHDWFADEKKGVSQLEKGKRKGAGVVFGEKIAREVRRGGRMMLLADIEERSIPGGKMTVVATHLEDKAKPSERLKQFEELLAQIQPATHPVVVAGDMNTSGSDSTPTSFQREVKKRLGSSKFWVTQGVKYATGVGFLYDITLGAVKLHRMRKDPTVKSVKFVSENPEEKFFSTLKDFRFADGGAFDFRGSKLHSVGSSGETFSDSNERAQKGFVSTMELSGKVSIGLKLDWIFVKPVGLTDPDKDGQPFTFAPQFGRTLKTLNYALKDQISDHSALIVDLPLDN